MGETIAEGNLELETVKDVTIRAKKTAVKEISLSMQKMDMVLR